MLQSTLVTPELTADSPGEAPKQIPSTAGMTTKVVKGSMWTLAGQVTPLLVSLITTPFVIRMLGAESYGLYILIVLIPSYIVFADFGMGLASTKFASEAYAEGDAGKEGRVVRTAALIALCVSAPFALTLLTLSGNILSLFSVPEHLRGEAALGLKIASVSLVVNFLNAILNTPQLTRLRMDLNTFITSGCRIAGILATPTVLYLGFGLLGAVSVLLVSSILTLLAHLLVSRRLLPNLILDRTIDAQLGMEMLRFGGAFVLSGIAAALLVNVEKGVLSATVSTVALAHYSVAFTLAGMMALFSTSMIQSLIPAFSQLQAAENREQLNSLYSRGVRLTLIWLVPVLVLLALAARPFFALWAGEEFAKESTFPFYVLIAGVAFNIVAYLPCASLLAAGKANILAKLYWVELIPYAIIVWYLASRFGALGAGIAWSLRVISDAFLQFYLAKRFTGVSVGLGSLGPQFLVATIMLVPLVMNFFLDSLSYTVIVTTLICLLSYCFFVYRTVLDAEEMSWLFSRLNRLLS